MAERMLLLEELRPSDALWLAASAARRGLANELASARIHLATGAFGTTVTFVVDDHPSEAFQAWLDDYRLRADRDPSAGALPIETAGMVSGLVTLLLDHCPASGDELEVSQQWLIIAPGVPREPVAELFESLRFHATSTRVAPVETPKSRRYLFHVLDDPERKSSFQSMMAADAFRHCLVLQGFGTPSGVLFLPSGTNPARDALESMTGALTEGPELFGLRSADVQDVSQDSSRPIAAVIPVSGEAKRETPTSRYQCLGLGRLTFYDEIQLAPSAARYAEVSVFDLSSSKNALEDLHNAIRKTRPKVGYRLELRHTRESPPLESERLKVRDQLTELEHQLAYLESMSKPRPYLLRFSFKQLPALGDYLRRVGMRILNSGALRYGFHATATNPSGWHFVLVDPTRVPSTEADLLTAWSELDMPPMRFWLDPFWARYYHASADNCLVFVPDRLALFPPMHAWSNADMDSYLSRVVSRWFEDRSEVPDLPAKPIYLFEGDARPSARILITVLDFANFQPLRTRLDWINDNLALSTQFDGEAFMKKLAEHASREHLLTEVTRRSGDAEARFEETAKRTARQVAGELEELTRVIATESDTLVKDLYKTVERLRRLRDGLQSLDRFRKDMENVSQETSRTVAETFRRESALQKDIRQLEAQILQAIRLRAGIEQRVEAEITSLQKTHDKLQEHFLRLIRRE